jgi:hypothetical protein
MRAFDPLRTSPAPASVRGKRQDGADRRRARNDGHPSVEYNERRRACRSLLFNLWRGVGLALEPRSPMCKALARLPLYGSEGIP